MKILILGASGQLGHALLRADWSAGGGAIGGPSGVEVTGLARPDFDIARPADIDALPQAYAPDLVINAAAYTAVDKAESEPATAHAVNAEGPGRLARVLDAAGGAPLIHVSTDYVFDGTKPAPYVEDDPIAPLNVYGASKAAGEAAVRAGNSRHLIVRTSWVYSDTGANFVKTMRRLGRERDQLGIVADQRGAPTSAADLAAAIVVMAKAAGDRAAADARGVWGTYHLTGGGETTWHGFAGRIFDHMRRVEGRAPAIRPLATADYLTPARRPANSRLDCTRVRSVFGIVMPAWEDSVDRVLAALDAADGIGPATDGTTETGR